MIAAGQHNYKMVLSVLMICSVVSCTKNFEEYNTNPNSLTDDQTVAILPSAYGPLQQEIFHDYQVAQNLSADAYAGYMMSPNPFAGGINNMTYALIDGWNQAGFNQQYNYVMGPISKIAAAGTRTKAPDLWAVALLIQVEAMHRVTDRFGPIPYTQTGVSITSIPYDDQKTVYETFFKQLDTAANNLQAYIAANPGKTQLAGSDLVYNGDYTQWLKLANSLRLRLAMRIVKADPVMAKKEAETAMSAPGGLLAVPGDDAAVKQSGGRSNDLWIVTEPYMDNRMGASLQSYLTGYKDPRLPVYCSPATDPLFKGKYIGIRIGSNIKSKDDYTTYASLNTTTTFTQTAPQLLMTAAEVWFLKAEAALRGWTGAGDVQANYEKGINTSMQQWGVAAGDYINNATDVPTAYADPKNKANDTTAFSTITIKWEPAATKEKQLERIITQKWLAIFPDGQEAWADFRRTGYPKLFSVVNNKSNDVINTTIQIRRLPFPTSEYNTNGAAVKNALGLLGGADNGGTRLWWDVNKGNF